jgi:hypothetical protein
MSLPALVSGLGLVVADLDHVDLQFQAEEHAAESQRAAPLSGAGLGSQPLDALFLVVVSLGDGGIGLVAARLAGAFVLVENLGRGIQRLLQAVGALQYGRPPGGIDILDLFRDIDVALLADFLHDKLHREKRGQVCRAYRLFGGRMEIRRQWFRQVGLNVVPLRRHLLLFKIKPSGFH